jgi:hypothetical protein
VVGIFGCVCRRQPNDRPAWPKLMTATPFALSLLLHVFIAQKSTRYSSRLRPLNTVFISACYRTQYHLTPGDYNMSSMYSHAALNNDVFA